MFHSEVSFQFFSFKIQHTCYRANNSIEVSIYYLHSVVIYLSKHQFYQHLCHYYASYLSLTCSFAI